MLKKAISVLGFDHTASDMDCFSDDAPIRLIIEACQCMLHIGINHRHKTMRSMFSFPVSTPTFPTFYPSTKIVVTRSQQR